MVPDRAHVEQAEVATSCPALLQFLGQLDPDTWAHVLLPALIDQGSASRVALTCSALRVLCHSSVQELKLTSVRPITAAAAQSWAESLAAHFPACTSISVEVACAADCEFTGHLMPALARLPQLTKISLTVNPGTPRQPTGGRHGLAPLLHTMRKDLSGLRSLSVSSKQDWKGASRLWSPLAQFTQLTELKLEFADEVSNACTGSELAALSKLQQLQSLEFDVDQAQTSDGDYRLLSPKLGTLSSLTSLEFGPCTLQEMRSISSCTALQNLNCGCCDGDETVVAPADWAALGQLTGLTDLSLLNGLATTASAESVAAFGQLRHLVSFGAHWLATDIIPDLAACTKLTRISGGWRSGLDKSGQVLIACDEHASTSATIPSVVTLVGAGGAIPFAAFPNLQTVLQGRSICGMALGNIKAYCTGLQSFFFSEEINDTPFLSLCEPGGSLHDTWQILSDLEGLSSLSASVRSDSELVAVAIAVNTLAARSLTQLELQFVSTPGVSASGLMHLARMCGLQAVDVFLPSYLDSFDANSALMFLCALGGVQTVCVHCKTPSQLTALRDARAELRESRLPAPSEIFLLRW